MTKSQRQLRDAQIVEYSRQHPTESQESIGQRFGLSQSRIALIQANAGVSNLSNRWTFWNAEKRTAASKRLQEQNRRRKEQGLPAISSRPRSVELRDRWSLHRKNKWAQMTPEERQKISDKMKGTWAKRRLEAGTGIDYPGLKYEELLDRIRTYNDDKAITEINARQRLRRGHMGPRVDKHGRP